MPDDVQPTAQPIAQAPPAPARQLGLVTGARVVELPDGSQSVVLAVAAGENKVLAAVPAEKAAHMSLQLMRAAAHAVGVTPETLQDNPLDSIVRLADLMVPALAAEGHVDPAQSDKIRRILRAIIPHAKRIEDAFQNGSQARVVFEVVRALREVAKVEGLELEEDEVRQVVGRLGMEGTNAAP